MQLMIVFRWILAGAVSVSLCVLALYCAHLSERVTTLSARSRALDEVLKDRMQLVHRILSKEKGKPFGEPDLRVFALDHRLDCAVLAHLPAQSGSADGTSHFVCYTQLTDLRADVFPYPYGNYWISVKMSPDGTLLDVLLHSGVK